MLLTNSTLPLAHRVLTLLSLQGVIGFLLLSLCYHSNTASSYLVPDSVSKVSVSSLLPATFHTNAYCQINLSKLTLRVSLSNLGWSFLLLLLFTSQNTLGRNLRKALATFYYSSIQCSLFYFLFFGLFVYFVCVAAWGGVALGTEPKVLPLYHWATFLDFSM